MRVSGRVGRFLGFGNEIFCYAGGIWGFPAPEYGREGVVWVEVGSGGLAMIRHVVPGHSLHQEGWKIGG